MKRTKSANRPTDPHPTRPLLSSASAAFLVRVLRFLLAIPSHRFAPRAAREGYTAREHATGWRLLRAAGGEERPLEHGDDEPAVATHGTAEELAIYQQLDHFENRWFPRMRAIIRRVVPPAERGAFAAAFFQNLEQQRLGPGVVASVGTFLTRVEALAQDPHPAAGDVARTLAERGLTPVKVQQMKVLLEQVRQAREPHERPPAESDAIRAAHEAQRRALSELRDWFNDWATTLRSAFPPREHAWLGLVRPAKGESAQAELASDPADSEKGTPVRSSNATPEGVVSTREP